jgi:hypothetical protein
MRIPGSCFWALFLLILFVTCFAFLPRNLLESAPLAGRRYARVMITHQKLAFVKLKLLACIHPNNSIFSSLMFLRRCNALEVKALCH